MSTSKPQQPRPGVPPAGTNLPGNQGAPNPYARFIPREELGNFSAWAPQTFEPRPADQPDVGVRKPTLAERAAAEMRPSMKPQQPVQHAPQAKGQAAAPQGAPAQNGAASGAKPAARRPVVGGMPGQAEAQEREAARAAEASACLLYTSPSPRDKRQSRMPSSA